jgi:cyclohexanone monooxygenase
LVDTDGKGVQSIHEKGLVANGNSYELDCIIFATGFEVGTGYSRRAGYDPIGKNSIRLSDKWADGVRTLHSFHAQGFPNLFIVGHAQGSYTTSYTYSYDFKAKHLSYIIETAIKEGAFEVEVTAQAEQEWVDEIISVYRNQANFNSECTPGYYNNEGKPSALFAQNSAYGKGPIPFFEKLTAWRNEGSLKGLEFRKYLERK